MSQKLVYIVKTEEYPGGIVCPELACVQGMLEEESEMIDAITTEMEVTIVITRMTEEQIEALPEA